MDLYYYTADRRTDRYNASVLITVSYLTCYCILCAQSAGRSGPGWGQCSASQLPHAWQCSAGLPVSGTQSQHCPGSREGRRSHSGDQGSHPSGVSVAVSQRRERKNVFSSTICFCRGQCLATQSPQWNLLPSAGEKGSSWGWRVRL